VARRPPAGAEEMWMAMKKKTVAKAKRPKKKATKAKAKKKK
jgi:hypothetical protein